MKGRRTVGKENIRSLVKTSGGKSYTLTLPRGIMRAFRWQNRQQVELSYDMKKKRITISDWPRTKAKKSRKKRQ